MRGHYDSLQATANLENSWCLSNYGLLAYLYWVVEWYGVNTQYRSVSERLAKCDLSLRTLPHTAQLFMAFINQSFLPCLPIL